MASSCTAKVVDASGASVVTPKPEARLNPAGRTMAPSVRLEVPALRTVKVRVSGVPGAVAPKLTWPVASGTAVAPSSTWASGPAGVTALPIRSIRTASAIR